MHQKTRSNVYITTCPTIGGWKAMSVRWDEDEQEYFPEQTAYLAHKDKKDAIAEGKKWAEAEGMEFRL
jgi:hypothetical protein